MNIHRTLLLSPHPLPIYFFKFHLLLSEVVNCDVGDSLISLFCSFGAVIEALSTEW